MAIAPVSFVLIFLIKPWFTAGGIIRLPMPVDSPIDEYSQESSSECCLPRQMMREKRESALLPLMHHESLDLGAIIASLFPTDYSELVGTRTKNSLDSIIPYNGYRGYLNDFTDEQNYPRINIWENGVHKSINNAGKNDQFDTNDFFKKGTDTNSEVYPKHNNMHLPHSELVRDQNIGNEPLFNLNTGSIDSSHPLHSPSIKPSKRSDIDDAQARMLDLDDTELNIPLSSEIKNPMKRSDITDINEQISDLESSDGLRKSASSLDTSPQDEFQGIEQRMLLFPNVIEFIKPADGLGGISARFLDSNEEILPFDGLKLQAKNYTDQYSPISELPTRRIDRHLEIPQVEVINVPSLTDNIDTLSPVKFMPDPRVETRINNPTGHTETHLEHTVPIINDKVEGKESSSISSIAGRMYDSESDMLAITEINNKKLVSRLDTLDISPQSKMPESTDEGRRNELTSNRNARMNAATPPVEVKMEDPLSNVKTKRNPIANIEQGFHLHDSSSGGSEVKARMDVSVPVTEVGINLMPEIESRIDSTEPKYPEVPESNLKIRRDSLLNMHLPSPSEGRTDSPISDEQGPTLAINLHPLMTTGAPLDGVIPDNQFAMDLTGPSVIKRMDESVSIKDELYFISSTATSMQGNYGESIQKQEGTPVERKDGSLNIEGRIISESSGLTESNKTLSEIPTK